MPKLGTCDYINETASDMHVCMTYYPEGLYTHAIFYPSIHSRDVTRNSRDEYCDEIYPFTCSKETIKFYYCIQLSTFTIKLWSFVLKAVKEKVDRDKLKECHS